jgi:hypothetical protein
MAYTNERTTEVAKNSFDHAYNSIQTRPDRNSKEVQYAMYIALGLKDLAVAIHEVYDKLEQIDRKLSTRP